MALQFKLKRDTDVNLGATNEFGILYHRPILFGRYLDPRDSEASASYKGLLSECS